MPLAKREQKLQVLAGEGRAAGGDCPQFTTGIQGHTIRVSLYHRDWAIELLGQIQVVEQIPLIEQRAFLTGVDVLLGLPFGLAGIEVGLVLNEQQVARRESNGRAIDIPDGVDQGFRAEDSACIVVLPAVGKVATLQQIQRVLVLHRHPVQIVIVGLHGANAHLVAKALIPTQLVDFVQDDRRKLIVLDMPNDLVGVRVGGDDFHLPQLFRRQIGRLKRNVESIGQVLDRLGHPARARRRTTLQPDTEIEDVEGSLTREAVAPVAGPDETC